MRIRKRTTTTIGLIFLPYRRPSPVWCRIGIIPFVARVLVFVLDTLWCRHCCCCCCCGCGGGTTTNKETNDVIFFLLAWWRRRRCMWHVLWCTRSDCRIGCYYRMDTPSLAWCVGRGTRNRIAKISYDIVRCGAVWCGPAFVVAKRRS